MAFVPMTAGGGGSMTETTLWTNTSPTANFPAQTITLSDDINNYSLIGIEYEFSITDTSMTATQIYKVDDFKTFSYNNNTNHMLGVLGTQASTSNYMYGRVVYYVSDTSIGFSLGYGINRNVSYQGPSTPIKIIGYK